MSKPDQKQSIKRKAKICAVFWTIIYCLIFPFLVGFGLLSPMVFDKPGLSVLEGLSIIFIISLIPLSVPVSIDLMWSSYVGEEYYKTLIFWSVPCLTIFVIFSLDSIIFLRT